MEHLYAHFPFCAARCDYCDFFSQEDHLDLATGYIEAMLAELAALERVGAGANNDGHVIGVDDIETLYLGGGTPTLVGLELLKKFLSGVGKYLKDGAEVTIEANPATIFPELVSGLLEHGVNRFSLGVQSFDPGLRRNLGRLGSVAAVARSVEALRAAGCENISLDMIFSIPGQTEAQLARDLHQVLALAPEHISYYELTVKPGSEYDRRWRRELGIVAAQGGVFYENVVDCLEGAGYRWYETSNFALPGRECRHNLAYWSGSDFIGIGAGAWSSVGGSRWHNVEDLIAYSEAATRSKWEGIRVYEQITGRERLAEILILGLRRDEGVERDAVDGVIDAGQENILLRNGFLVNKGGRICLTRAGRFVANEVCARLLRD